MNILLLLLKGGHSTQSRQRCEALGLHPRTRAGERAFRRNSFYVVHGMTTGTTVLVRTGNLAAVMKTMGYRDVKTAMHYQHPELDVVRAAWDCSAASETAEMRAKRIRLRHFLRHTPKNHNLGKSLTAKAIVLERKVPSRIIGRHPWFRCALQA